LGLLYFIDEYTENLRKYISVKILETLIRRIDKIDSELIKINCHQFVADPHNLNVTYKHPFYQAWKNSNDSGYYDFFSNPHNSNIVKARIETEDWLRIPTYSMQYRAYIVHRIRELAKGGALADFLWDSGSTNPETEERWSPALPTDTDIIIHVFSIHMNHLLPPAAYGKPFVGRYFKRENEIDAIKKSHVPITLAYAETKSPHFKLFLKGGTIWEPLKGRNNMFHAIVLFIYYFKTREDNIVDGIQITEFTKMLG